tara:strand:+ start:1370 stop:1582 length:213 start_codon:yes stop_codon:yes gene_type:complete
MRGKVSYNKNYISKSLEDFFRYIELLPIERKIIRDCIIAQQQYGKLTNRRWERIMQIYKKYSEGVGKNCD